MGVAWGSDLDHATNWGQLQLAADVQDDGGRAFKGPSWIEAVWQTSAGTVANRLQLTDSSLREEHRGRLRRPLWNTLISTRRVTRPLARQRSTCRQCTGRCQASSALLFGRLRTG